MQPASIYLQQSDRKNKVERSKTATPEQRHCFICFLHLQRKALAQAIAKIEEKVKLCCLLACLQSAVLQYRRYLRSSPPLALWPFGQLHLLLSAYVMRCTDCCCYAAAKTYKASSFFAPAKLVDSCALLLRASRFALRASHKKGVTGKQVKKMLSYFISKSGWS